MNPLVVSATEASKLLMTDVHVVLKLLEYGELPGYREGRNWKIPLSLLSEYVDRRALEETKKRKDGIK